MTDYGDYYGLGKAHAIENMTVQQAVARLRHAFKTDPSFRETWKANIAMAFYDEINHLIAPTGYLRTVSNKAAERFLQQLEKE